MNLRRLAQLCLPIRGAALMLGGCAAVAVRPEGELPKPLVVPTPAKVGVVVTTETGNYVHKESRASVNYEAQLGPSHKHIVEQIFKAAFTDAKMFDSVDAARLEPGLHGDLRAAHRAVFVRQLARNRRRVYCAVTIRYQILIYAPNGELIETLTLTGYGSGPAPKIGNGEEELGIAALCGHARCGGEIPHAVPGAGRGEAAAGLAGAGAQGRAAPGSPEAAAAVAEMTIEAVPINDSPVVAHGSAYSPSPPAPSPASSGVGSLRRLLLPPSQMASPSPATSL